MRTIDRLVLVLAFWGGMLMLVLLAVGAPQGATPGKEIWLITIPGILAAMIIYPIAWIAAGSR